MGFQIKDAFRQGTVLQRLLKLGGVLSKEAHVTTLLQSRQRALSCIESKLPLTCLANYLISLAAALQRFGKIQAFPVLLPQIL